MSCGTDCCSTEGKCVACASRECREIRRQMDDISALREVVRAELANATALRDVKGLLGSITGEYQSPAAELRTSEGLHRQIEALDRQLDALFDQWAETGCSIF